MGRLDENDGIDLILSCKDEILPSSGFAVSVMEVVRREAAAPPPIPFPWKRALPGLIVGGLILLAVLVAGVIGIAQLGKASAGQIPTFASSGMPPLLHGGIESAAVWVLLALLTAFLSVKLSMRLASSV